MKHVLTLEDTQPCAWTNPGYLNISDTHGKTFKPFADYMNNLGSDESRRLWSVCLYGLKLFGLTEEHVTNVVGIRLAVRYAKKVCKVYFKYFFFSIKVATKAYSERVHIFTVYASVFFLSHFK